MLFLDYFCSHYNDLITKLTFQTNAVMETLKSVEIAHLHIRNSFPTDKLEAAVLFMIQCDDILCFQAAFCRNISEMIAGIRLQNAIERVIKNWKKYNWFRSYELSARYTGCA